MPAHSIVVAGDVVIDWTLATLPPAAEPSGPSQNWQQYRKAVLKIWPGGALLLAALVRSGARILGNTMSVVTHKLDNCEAVPADQVVRTFISVDRFSDGFYRVKDFLGFCGTPRSAVLQYESELDASVVIINDAGNVFRNDRSRWPKSFRESTPQIIAKLSPPFRAGKLWHALRNDHRDRVLAIVSADDLRNDGVHISRGISWDRTAADCMLGMDNELLRELAEFPHLLIRFGLDGVLHHRKDHDDKIRMFYDPDSVEGEFAEGFGGTMSGFGAVFCASLALDFHNKPSDLDLAIRQALVSSRHLLQTGYGETEADLELQYPQVFGRSDDLNAKIAISHLPRSLRRVSMESWSFLREIVGDELPALATRIVRTGTMLPGTVPIARFGGFETLDRSEGESYRSLRILFREFLMQRTAVRPLSVAVFGQPGAGKSFGITELVNSIDRHSVESMTPFNLAQFASVRDLIYAFHRVRDVALTGKIPLVFFDEFDAKLEGRPLGWLKYFLAPMQDGKFTDSGTLHPIGKAIFVFAGGTYTTFDDFREQARETDVSDAGKQEKVPDFASRLRGYLNIVGLDPVDANDKRSIIRRAVTLRSLLVRKFPFLVKESEIEIDDGVLRAFLFVSSYRHGVRSMEALLEMSTLSNKRRFAGAALPSHEQIDLHVDASEFRTLLAGE